jgi:hypothetical protein
MRQAAKRMKRTIRPFISIILGFVLALSSAALTYSTPPALQGTFGGTAFFLQSSSAPPPQELSEIGSTDGIVIMGFAIVLIIIVPIFLQRKKWMENR